MSRKQLDLISWRVFICLRKSVTISRGMAGLNPFLSVCHLAEKMASSSECFNGYANVVQNGMEKAAE